MFKCIVIFRLADFYFYLSLDEITNLHASCGQVKITFHVKEASLYIITQLQNNT